MRSAWVNGKLVPEEEARIPLMDRGFLYGEGCFETIRIHDGAPFRFDAHLRRLHESLHVLDLESPERLVDVREGARALGDHLKTSDYLLRITVTPPHPEAKLEGIVAITARALPAIPSEIVLHVAQSVRRMPGPLARAKSLSRVTEMIALREARRAGAFDALLLNPRGNVVETTARNVFAVHGEALLTPPATEGALEGVTRTVVIELARKFGILVKETPIPMETLLGAEEVFLTGTGVGVASVAKVHAHRYDPLPGPSTGRLAEAYDKVLNQESKW